jgi:hypothetical protein
MTLTQKQVLSRAAFMRIKRYGEGAVDVAVERMRALAMAGDEAGTQMWKEIAYCVNQISVVECQS